jgi:transcription initiation factor TFIIH subunit 1
LLPQGGLPRSSTPAGLPTSCRAAGTQQAPGKPFIKLDTATGPLILGFETVGDRDDAVELLKQVKPPTAAAARPAAPGTGTGGAGKLLLPTAQQAAALFKADRDLESIYKSLVVTGVLTEHEFWQARQPLLRAALAPGGVGSAGGGGAPQRVHQRVGLSSAMLAEVKPSADGQTEKVLFQLTPQIIQQASLLRRGWNGEGAVLG